METLSERLIAAARDVLKVHGYFVDNLWHINDVLFLCEQLGYQRLTDEQAMEVFAIANRDFDGEYGINWPQLERALICYVNQLEVVSPTPPGVAATLASA